MSGALRHFLERSARLHLAAFTAWFPTTFDWEALCADLPGMARRTGRQLPELPGEDGERLLEDAARGVFRGAHLATLGLLAAVAEGEDDPAALVERLTAGPPEDEEEAVFTRLASRRLAAVELCLAEDAEGARDAATRRAARIVEVVWPALAEVLLQEDEGRLGAGDDGSALLWGVAKVAAILAAFRWMAAEREAPGWPRLALERDAD